MTAEKNDDFIVIIVAGVGENFGAGHDIVIPDMQAELDEYPRDFSNLGRTTEMDRGVY